MEHWQDLEDFPGYAVSSYGRVQNTLNGHIKIPTRNQMGIPSVNLIKDRVQYRRSVARLVARAFLPAPSRETFDTPINLDGDRTNNHVDNLMWRPRWFAVKYHAQLRDPELSPAFGYSGAVEVVDTGERFVSARDCATKYGLLEREIVLSAMNNVPVFPTWQTFRRAD
jgi:hypothetical protein